MSVPAAIRASVVFHYASTLDCVPLGSVDSATPVPRCPPTELLDPIGTIQTPKYPDDYPVDIECEWKIRVEETKVTDNCVGQILQMCHCRPRMGVTKPIFSVVRTHVSYWISRLYLTGVTAAQLGAPVKYKRDSKNPRGTFARSKILIAEKLTNGALVTPTPEVSGHRAYIFSPAAIPGQLWHIYKKPIATNCWKSTVFWCVASYLEVVRNVILTTKYSFICGFFCIYYIYFSRKEALL